MGRKTTSVKPRRKKTPQQPASKASPSTEARPLPTEAHVRTLLERTDELIKAIEEYERKAAPLEYFPIDWLRTFRTPARKLTMTNV
jgi:hypothetical protein